MVAGMSPNSLTSSNSVFDRIHRGTSFIVFIDGLIVMYLFWAISGMISPSASTATLGFVSVGNFIIWSSYRNRTKWAYWPAATLILIAGLFFGINAIDSLVIVMTGNLGGLLFLFLTGWATFGSFRRFLYQTVLYPPSYI